VHHLAFALAQASFVQTAWRLDERGITVAPVTATVSPDDCDRHLNSR